MVRIVKHHGSTKRNIKYIFKNRFLRKIAFLGATRAFKVFLSNQTSNQLPLKTKSSRLEGCGAVGRPCGTKAAQSGAAIECTSGHLAFQLAGRCFESFYPLHCILPLLTVNIIFLPSVSWWFLYASYTRLCVDILYFVLPSFIFLCFLSITRSEWFRRGLSTFVLSGDFVWLSFLVLPMSCSKRHSVQGSVMPSGLKGFWKTVLGASSPVSSMKISSRYFAPPTCPSIRNLHALSFKSLFI